MTRASAPTQPPPHRPAARILPVGCAEERTLRTFLKNHHRGEREAITKPRLLEALARDGLNLDRRELDELLRAQRAAGFPVAATDAGVFWAIRAEELTKARHAVASRFRELRETVEAYDRILAAWAAQVQVPGQPAREPDGQGLLFAVPSAGPARRRRTRIGSRARAS